MLLTPHQVAERLQISRRTVDRLAADGELHRLKVRGATRFDSSDVDGYLARLRGDRQTPAVAGITEGQLRAFHAKANELDRVRKLPRAATKAAILDLASERFCREIVSASDLSAREASELLDVLEQWQEQG